MSHVLDTVPNHVGVATNENNWWNDVLERGPASPYAAFFDIAWRGSPRPELHDKVLLPVLGGHYADVLEKGELKLVVEPGGAVGLATLLAGKLDLKGKTAVAVLSGGNIDPELFHKLVA